jgi:hypothetical protein
VQSVDGNLSGTVLVSTGVPRFGSMEPAPSWHPSQDRRPFIEHESAQFPIARGTQPNDVNDLAQLQYPANMPPEKEQQTEAQLNMAKEQEPLLRRRNKDVAKQQSLDLTWQVKG